MPLKDIQLATISPSNRADGRFVVIVHSDDGQKVADFDCDNERDAIHLRNAIREYASRLRYVANFNFNLNK